MATNNLIDSQGELVNDTPLGVDQVNPSNGLDLKSFKINVEGLKEEALYPSGPTGRIYTQAVVPKSVYRILDDNYHPEFDPEYNAELLATNQTNAGKFVNMLNQAVVGEIMGGSIEGLSYLMDIPMMVDLAEGTEQEFGNAFTEIGKKLGTWAEEVAPIYTSPTAPKFNPTSWEWWMKNLPSVASTASLVIPSMAGMKALQKVGELTGMAGKLGQLGGFSKLFTTSLGQAIMSRHMESLMEAQGVYDQGLNDAKAKLFAKYQTQIENEINSLPVFTPTDLETGPKPGQYTREQYEADVNKIKNKWDNIVSGEAVKVASVGAANTYSKNWVMLLQDLPQYMMLNKFIKPGAKTIGAAAKEESAGVAKRLGANMPKFYASKTMKHIGNMLGEGGEEHYQFIVGQQSSDMISNLNDPNYKSSLVDTWKQDYDSGDLWTNTFFGAIGAGVVQGAMSGINSKALMQSANARIKNINTWSGLMNKLHGDYVAAEELGDEALKEAAVQNFVAATGLKSIELGNKEHLLDMVDALSSDDQNVLSNYEMATDTRQFMKGKKQVADEIKNSVNNLEKKYKDSLVELTKRGIKEKDARPLARSMAHSNHMLEYLNGKLVEQQNKLKSTEVEGYSKPNPAGELLSDQGRQIFELQNSKNDLERRIAYTEKQIASDKTNADEKARLKKQAERLTQKVAVTDTRIKELEKDPTRTAEQKKVDKQLMGTKKTPGTMSATDVNNFIETQKLSESYEESINYFRDTLDKTREISDKLSTDSKTTAAPAKPAVPVEEDEEDLAVGSIVTYGDGKKGIVKEIEYADKDTEGNEQVPAAENVDNVVTIQPLDAKGEPVGEVEHVMGTTVTPLDKETQDASQEGVGEDDVSEYEALLPAEGTTTGDNLKDQNRHKTNSTDRGLMEFLSYTEYEPTDPANPKKLKRLLVRNQELDDYISDPNNQKYLPTAVATYEIDKKNKHFNDIIEKLAKDKKIPFQLLEAYRSFRDKGTKLTADEIKKLSGYADFFGNVAVSVNLTINGKKFKGGMFLHTLNKTRNNLKDEATYNKYVQMRQSIIKHLLAGDSIYTTGLSTNRGNPNNIDKTNAPDARKRNVSQVLGVPPGNLELYILKSSTKHATAKSYSDPRLQKSADSIENLPLDFSSVGSVFVKTDKTINGQPFALKLNKSYISSDHASLIFNAFAILASTEMEKNVKGTGLKSSKKGYIGYYNAKFHTADSTTIDPATGKPVKEPEVWNLSVGEFLDLMIVHGKDLTDPDSKRYKRVNELKSISEQHKTALKTKRLFLERGYDENGNVNAVYLAFGVTTPYSIPTAVKGEMRKVDYNRINLTDKRTTKNAQDAHYASIVGFREWLMSNKTYAVHLENKVLGLKLNGSFLQGRSFRLGKKGLKFPVSTLEKGVYHTPSTEITRDPGESYASFLIRNNFVTTDIEEKNGKLFSTPFLHLGMNLNDKADFGIKVGTTPNSKPIEEEPAKPVKRTRGKVKAKTESSNDDVNANPKDLPPSDDKKNKTERIIHDDDIILRERPKRAPKSYERQDLEKELAWVRKRINIGNDDVEIEKRLANMMVKGKRAWGIYSSAGITLYEAAEKGTIYHEAFHRVSLGYFTKEEREAFYRSARQLYKMPKETFTDKEVEEKLAEEFRTFVITKQSEAQPSLIKRIFKGIYDFFGALFFGRTRLTHSDVNRLFNQIYSGRYRFSKIRPENYTVDARLREVLGTEFDSINTYADIKTVTKYIARILISKNNITNLNNVRSLKWAPAIEEIEKRLKGLEKEAANPDMSDYERSQNEQYTAIMKDVLGEKDASGNYPKFNVFKTYVNRFLGNLGINARVHEISNEEIYDNPDFFSTLDDTERPNKIDSAYGKVDYSTSTKDNALSSVRFIINTLYDTGEIQANSFIAFADGNKVWYKLLNDIIEFDDITDMIDKIRQIGEEQNYYPYTQLADILTRSSDDFKTQFQTTFEQYKHDFIYSTFSEHSDGTVSMVFDSASHNELARNTAKTWNEFLTYDTNVVQLQSEKKGEHHTVREKVVNEEFFNTLNDKYDSRVVDYYNEKSENGKYLLDEPDLEELFSRMAKILSELHINVSTGVLRRYTYSINTTRPMQDNLPIVIEREIKELFGPDLLVDSDGDFKNIISNGTVYALAKAYADVNVNEESEMVIGAGGDKFFKYGRLNIATDNVRRIKRSSKWAEEKRSRIYNKRSRLLTSFVPKDDSPEARLEAANNRERFGLVTVSHLKNRVGGDRGKEYLKFNDIEDYLFKAYAIMEGDLLPLPVMANRQTYYMMKGAKTIGIHDENGNASSVLKSINKDGTVVFSDEVINQFYEYYLDEKERVDTAKAFRTEYKKERDSLKAQLKEPDADTVTINKKLRELKNLLIRNYHYIGNSYDVERGNAYNFIHFKGFDKLKKVEDVRSEINDVLNERLKDELRFVHNQEIVRAEFDKEKGQLTLYNKMIADKLIANRASIESDELPTEVNTKAIINVIASIMVNTQMSVIESEKLFLADPAFFNLNNAGDKTNPDTFEAMYKRWFGVGSTGTRLRVKYPGRSTSYNVSILETQKFKSNVFDALVPKHSEFYYELLRNRVEEKDQTPEVLAKLKKDAKDLAETRLSKFQVVDPTDGTALISPEMYKEITQRYLGWDDRKEEAYQLLMSDKELSAAEILKASNVVFSPLKTMYIGTQNFNGIDLLIYNKMAMFTLFRQHVKGTFLEEVLDRMETKGIYADKGLDKIHVYNYDSAVKTGSLTATKLFADKGKRDKLNDLSESFVFEQSFDNLKHQQVVEPHNLMEQTFGTAGFKIATADINKAEPYGKYNTGQELLESITRSRVTLSNLGLHKVDSMFGVANGKISDQRLVEMLRRDAEQAKKSFDFIKALRTTPDGEKYLELDAFNDRKWIYSRIKSIIDSETVDLNTPGTQLVQMSDYGMTNAEYKEELAFVRSNEGDSRVYEMECRVSIRLFKGFFPKGYDIKESDIIELLESNPLLFGYRVPTQGQNSLVKLKIVDFLPEQAGDIIQLPLEFTALTGSDFDIDKLYVAMYNYDTVEHKDGTYSLSKVPFSESEEEAKTRYTDKIIELFEIYKDSADSFRNIMSVDEDGKKVPIVSKYFMGYGKSTQELEQEAENATPENQFFANARLAIREAINVTDLQSLQDALIQAGKLVSFEEFKKLSLEEQNSERANQNKLLDDIFTVMSDEKHLVNTTTPLGAMTDILEKKAKEYNEIYNAGAMDNVPALYTTIPSFQAKMKSKFSSSTFGIAPYALANNHHSLTQMAGVVMLDAPNFGFNENRRLPLDRLIGEDNMYITWWLSALIDAHVDGVNKPYITELNVNEATHDVVNYLVRAGLGETTFDYLNQPILREYSFNFFKNANEKNGRNTSITPIKTKDVFEYTVDFWKNQLIEAKVFTEEQLKDSVFNKHWRIPLAKLLDPKQLKADAKEYTQKTRSKEFYVRQLSILSHHKEIQENADALTKFVLASRVDTKKYGSNPVEILHFLNSINQVIASGRFENIDKIFPTKEVKGEFELDKNYVYKDGDTFLPTMVQNSMLKIFKILRYESIYATPGFNDLLLEIVDSTASGDFNRMGMINTIMEELVTYFMGKFFADPVNGFGMDFNKLSDLIFEKENSIYETIYQLKTKTHPLSNEVEGNAFIESVAIDFSTKLITDRDGEEVPYTYIKALFRSLREDMEQDELRDGFRNLLVSPKDELRQLALNLYLYSFYTSAMRNKHFSFVNSIPAEMNREIMYEGRVISWNNYLKGIMSKLNTDDGYLEYLTESKREVFTNLATNQSMVWIVDDTLVEDSFVTADKNEDLFAIKLKMTKEIKRTFLGLNSDRERLFSPYVKNNNLLFEYIGYDAETGMPYYVAIPSKGFGEKGISLNEYGIKHSKPGLLVSILASNNPTTKAYTYLQLIEQLKTTLTPQELSNFRYVPLTKQTIAENKRGLYDTMFDKDEAGEMREQQADEVVQAKLQNKVNRLNRTIATIAETVEGETKEGEFYATEFTPENITKLGPNEVFVFGSNTEGRHGKGAALTARQKFGAIYGQAEGMQGKSYAIITKDLSIGERSFPIMYSLPGENPYNIADGVRKFLKYAEAHPELKFYVTKIGIKNAGYTIEEMKHVFDIERIMGAGISDNVILPKEFEVRPIAKPAGRNVVKEVPLTEEQRDYNSLTDWIRPVDISEIEYNDTDIEDARDIEKKCKDGGNK